MPKAPEGCEWTSLKEALLGFVRGEFSTTSQRHIRPLHWYMACRLCLEGGFDPGEITPRPPFRVNTIGSGARARRLIEYDPSSGRGGELTVLGGLKTKKVDVVVTKPNIGPVIAISIKGTLNALRNLTNRLEEAGGDCTNLHITYPTLVYAYWGIIRGNRAGRLPPDAPAFLGVPGDLARSNDVVILENGQAHQSVVRYHLALSNFTGRNAIRNDVSKYEAVCLAIVNVDGDSSGSIHQGYPTLDSPLHFSKLMPSIYRNYDLRFVYGAPDIRSLTERKGWDEYSPVLKDWRAEEYELRMATESHDSEEEGWSGI